MFDCPFLTRAEAIETNKVTPYFADSLGSLKGLTCHDLSFSCISDFLLCSLALEALPLRELILQDCFNYTYHGISYLLSKCRFLQLLDLQDAKFLNDQRINELSVYLADLVSINVSGCYQLTYSSFFALLRNFHLLAEIRMESTNIGNGSKPSVDLDSVVYHQVKSLHLAKNLLFKRCLNIKHLNFAFCSWANLFSINHEASKLEVLNLSHSRIDNRALYAISKICPRLLQLDLEHCYYVTEKGVRQVVENCIHLREINLRSCRKVSTNVVSWMIFSRPSLKKVAAPPHFRPRDNDRKPLFRRCLVC
ncbi:putative leucine-rich repeat domain, L domain-containing protein [Medicago truncatula]|uniref:Putative leucine-rich repeat domain, L domain-containing protein n=1 Tax=Medicago truncatula TaxID=3880 RepID=A0A396IUC4_MEDTR|nr:putative leucine-rich repeat domain, L domain-containing protein [Medicago truncatula]